MRRPPDLLRAELDRDAGAERTLVGRLARWLSTEARALGRLRAELARCRLDHTQELNRLRTLVDDDAFKHPHDASEPPDGPAPPQPFSADP
jgi:hypothetical protein